jgi:hypothetical protein
MFILDVSKFLPLNSILVLWFLLTDFSPECRSYFHVSFMFNNFLLVQGIVNNILLSMDFVILL